jgi:hypothetical protein
MRLSFVMCFTALLMNIGESTFYNQLLQAFLWMWLGLGVSCAESIALAGRACAAGSRYCGYGVPAGTFGRPALARTFRPHG